MHDTLTPPASPPAEANAVRAGLPPEPVNIKDTALLAELAARDEAALSLELAKALGRYDENKKCFRSDLVRRSLRGFADQGLVTLSHEGDGAALTGRGRAIWRALSGEADAPGPGGAFGVLHHMIEPDPDNARTLFDEAELDELAEDIAEKTMLQNIILRENPGKPGYFILVGGERRWRAVGRLIAAKDTRWPWTRPLPALIREYAETNDAALEALSENLQRVNLNPVEEARAFKRLVDEGLSTADLANRIKKTQRFVQQRLALLNLPEEDQKAVAEKRMSVEQARNQLAGKPGLQSVSAAAKANLVDAPAKGRPAAPDRETFDEAAWTAKVNAVAAFMADENADPDSWRFWNALYRRASALDLAGREMCTLSVPAMSDILRALYHGADKITWALDMGEGAGWIVCYDTRPSDRGSQKLWGLTVQAMEAAKAETPAASAPAPDAASLLRRARAQVLDATETLAQIVVPELKSATAHNVTLEYLERAADALKAAADREAGK